MAHEVSTGIDIVAVGIIDGTDVFCAVVQRSAMARVSDDVLTQAMGYAHRCGDQRLRIPGAISLIATGGAAVAAAASDADTVNVGFGCLRSSLCWCGS